MDKVIIPKNVLIDYTVTTINYSNVDINCIPQWTYEDGYLGYQFILDYVGDISLQTASTNVYINITLFDSQVKSSSFIYPKYLIITLQNFPKFIKNTSNSSSTLIPCVYVRFKKFASDSTYTTLSFKNLSTTATSIDATYYLIYNSNEANKYSDYTSIPLELSKAVVPKNWMSDEQLTYQVTPKSTLSITTGDLCPQPYLGRQLTISGTLDTVFYGNISLYITTKDRFLDLYVEFPSIGNDSMYLAIRKCDIYVNNSLVLSKSISLQPSFIGGIILSGFIDTKMSEIIDSSKAITIL